MAKNAAYLIIGVLLSAPILFGFFGKSYNRATKKDELILVSTESEKKIGASIAEQVVKKFEGADDPLLCKRVEEIGNRVAKVCERRDITYRFKVLKAEKDDYYNAFALPGGYVYIFDALVKKLNNDDEIAAILAHELGHIAAKHSIKKLQASMGINALMLLGVGMKSDSQSFVNAGYALGQLMMAHSREAEVEADELAVRYLKNSDFDPKAVLSTLKLLKALQKKGPIRRYMYYRSHPYLSERIARVKTEITGQTSFESFINLPEEKDKF